jgi:hypothetical protein
LETTGGCYWNRHEVVAHNNGFGDPRGIALRDVTGTGGKGHMEQHEVVANTVLETLEQVERAHRTVAHVVLETPGA